jgi:Family of unknown function (DUF5519)
MPQSVRGAVKRRWRRLRCITASQQIIEEVSSWPGVEAGPGPRGEFGFRVGGRELGHLHGDFAAHFSFPKKLGLRLRAEGRVTDHPVFQASQALQRGESSTTQTSAM